MSKLAMEILSGKNPTVAELRNKIAETENSLWYNPNRNLNMGKYAGTQGDLGVLVEQVDKSLKEDFANLAEALVTGKANALEFVLIVQSVDINLTGATKHQGRICLPSLQ